jgi:hypothetical protein
MRWSFVLAVLLAAGACVQSEVVVCPSGRVCPVGDACDPVNDRCISPAQRAACMGLVEGDPCTIRNIPGTCTDGLCEARFCGDGVRAQGEACDGADLGGASCATLNFYGETTGLSCYADCTFDTRGCSGGCGDEIRNGSELCDHDDLGTATCKSAGYYQEAGLACSPFCTYDVSGCSEKCGDLIKNGPEFCDGAPPSETCVDAGLDAGVLGCSLACSFDLAACARFGWRFEQSFPLGSAQIQDVDASAANNIWVSTDTAAYRFDGVQWKSTTVAVTTNNVLEAIETTGPADAWAVEQNGVLWHYNGSAWAKDTTAPSGVRSVWALAPNDIWVATSASGVRRWNGSTWSDVGGLTQTGLSLIRGRDANDVWVATPGGSVYHWNGGTWTARPLTNGMTAVDAYPAGPDEAWFVGGIDSPYRAHWYAGAWTYAETNLELGGDTYRSITGTGPNDMWATRNSGGGAEHYDGYVWHQLDVPIERTVHAIDAGNVIGFESAKAYRYTGQAYAVIPPAPVFTSGDMYVTRTGHLFTPSNATGNPVAHWDGKTWTTPSAGSAQVMGVWGTAENDVWGAGRNGKPTHFDGSNWSEQTSVANTAELRTVWGSGANDVWFGGFGGVVLHYENGTWTNRDIAGISNTVSVGTFTGSGPNDVWTTAATKLWHWTGSWTEVAQPTGSGSLVAMVSVGPGELVAIKGSKAFRLSGGVWTETPLPHAAATPFFLAGAPDDLFAIGQPDVIYHYDGTRWSLVRAPADAATNSIARVYVQPHRVDMFFVGSSRILRTLIRTQPWHCESEVGHCNDAVDNDCDGALDGADPDC